MPIFDIVTEPRGDTYRQLLTACAASASMGLLVVRVDDTIGASAKDVLRKLQPHVIETREESEWPGTRLLQDKANVYRFKLHPTVLSILQNAVFGLYEWIEPLPEDLCLLRRDGSAVLVTISHERDAYLDLTADEVALLARVVPSLELARRSTAGE